MNIRRIAVLFFLLMGLYACRQAPEKDPVIRIVNEWRGKEIKFPQNLVYTIQGRDTVAYSTAGKDYRILTYVDSAGCMSCKLKIDEWKKFIAYLDSSTDGKVGFLFFFHPNKIKDVSVELHINDFKLPVCIDNTNSMSRLNSFPDKFDYQTFLLDKQNRVVAIGNPVNNAAVKELYLNFILNRKAVHHRNTEISVSTCEIDMGDIKQKEQKDTAFTLRNIGNAPLVIIGVNASCGCMKTEYAKAPVGIREETTVRMVYTPKEKGAFRESMIIRGNIPEPVKVVLKGTVVE